MVGAIYNAIDKVTIMKANGEVKSNNDKTVASTLQATPRLSMLLARILEGLVRIVIVTTSCVDGVLQGEDGHSLEVWRATTCSFRTPPLN